MNSTLFKGLELTATYDGPNIARLVVIIDSKIFVAVIH